MKTIPPVLLIVFNRPETTRRVVQRLRELRVPKLYVAGDGPRPDRPEDVGRVAAARVRSLLASKLSIASHLRACPHSEDAVRQH